MPLLYTLGRWTVAPLLRTSWRPEVEGLDLVPELGGAILASNHLSVADELLLGSVVPRHVSFWAKAEYFTGSGVGGLITRMAVTGVGAIPVVRGNGRAALAAFDGAIPVLRAGGLVAIYPEGTRSPDGRLYRGRTGVARLALAAEVPIVPVGVTGTDRVQPIGAPLPKLRSGEVTLRFGKPMEVAGRPSDARSLRAITDEVITEIQKLTGQEYTGTYAPPRPG